MVGLGMLGARNILKVATFLCLLNSEALQSIVHPKTSPTKKPFSRQDYERVAFLRYIQDGAGPSRNRRDYRIEFYRRDKLKQIEVNVYPVKIDLTHAGAGKYGPSVHFYFAIGSLKIVLAAVYS